MKSAFDLSALEAAMAGEGGAAASAEQRDALQSARRAGKAAKRPALVEQAVVAVDAERNIEGARLAMRAVKDHPEHVEAYLAGAVALDRLGFLTEALAFYEQALARSPNNPHICALLGTTAQRCNRPELAEQFFRVAMRLQPESLSHVNNLAGVLRDQGRFDDAIELLRASLYGAPEAAALWNTLGTVLQEQGDPQNALTFLDEAVRLDSSQARTHHNRAIALADLGRFSEACDALDRGMAHAKSPAERAEMRSARAYARLGSGRLEEGWADYEARFDLLTRHPTLIVASRPRWTGAERLDGKRLLIMGEQGLGDEIMFLTAAQEAIRQASATTIACEARLQPLIARSFPSARVIRHYTSNENGRVVRRIEPQHWDDVDVWTPAGALPGTFRRTPAHFPAACDILKPDRQRTETFKNALSSDGGLKVGVVWKSLVMSAKRARYFAPFSAWEPVFKVAGAVFYSLQYGDAAEDIDLAANGWNARVKTFDGLDVKDDLDGVAAASSALDLVIGPLNASTNIAAACGQEIWLVERQPDWTALGAPAGFPWYPRAKVFRPEADGDWRSVFPAIATALRARVEAHVRRGRT